MCGRYSLHHKAREVADRFDAALNFPFEPRYNIAPSQEISAILADPSGIRTLEGLRWGLVPHWTRDIAAARRPINARAETLAEKLTFREALRRGRCLIPASGFYEWQKQGKSKQPFYIRRRDGGLFAFAGLWDERAGSGEVQRTCCIVTTTPNDLMAPIHDRMPCILAPGDEGPWLDVRGVRGPNALSLLRPYPDAELEEFPVSPRVNNPENDSPACIAPLR